MRPASLLLVFLALPLAAQDRVGDPEFDTLFRHIILPIEGARACHRFRVYLAESREQQARGLMFVRHMNDDDAMLFVYRRPGRISMWMRNTFIPLDMVFADAAAEILNIERDTRPLSRTTIVAAGDAAYVLELNAGISARLGLTVGQVLFQPQFTAFRP